MAHEFFLLPMRLDPSGKRRSRSSSTTRLTPKETSRGSSTCLPMAEGNVCPLPILLAGSAGWWVSAASSKVSFYDGVAGLVDGVFFQDGQDRISLTLIDADKFEVEWQAHRPSSPSRPH